MDFQKILNGVVSKTLNIDDGKFAEILKDGDNELSESEIISKILKLDVDRIKTIKNENGTEKFQEGFKKAKKESLTELENELKDKYGIESSNMGLDLINEIVEKNSKPSETSEDDIRKSKIYLDLETKLKNEIKELKTNHTKEVETIKNSYEGEKVLSAVNKSAMNVLKSLNPILPKNEEIAQNQISAFLEKFKDFNFEIQGDRIVVLDKDKKIVQDDHGNTIEFGEIVKQRASGFWEFANNNGGSGSGNEGGQGGQGGSGYKKPESLEELTNLMNDSSIDNAEKLKIAEEYEKNSSK